MRSRNCVETQHNVRIVSGSAYPMIWIRIEIGWFHFVAMSCCWRRVRVATVPSTGGFGEGGCFFFDVLLLLFPLSLSFPLPCPLLPPPPPWLFLLLRFISFSSAVRYSLLFRSFDDGTVYNNTSVRTYDWWWPWLRRNAQCARLKHKTKINCHHLSFEEQIHYEDSIAVAVLVAGASLQQLSQVATKRIMHQQSC